ncbi:MAG: hypothetical protein GQ581_06525 [Methyloprofundus sp.]|nr:hypothetical protein [Methyloprofundus sp.]
MNITLKIPTLLLLILFFSIKTTYAFESASNLDVDRLFSWAEYTYPETFTPAPTTQSQNEWRFRFYSNTNVYIGVNNNNDVYVFGNMFGGLVYISPLHELLTVIAGQTENNTSNGTIIHQFLGSWEGDLSTNTASYAFRFAINDADNINALNTTSNCEVLFVVSDTFQDQLILQGTLLSGNCIPDPIAKLTYVSENELLYELFAANENPISATPLATGNLFKVRN